MRHFSLFILPYLFVAHLGAEETSLSVQFDTDREDMLVDERRLMGELDLEKFLDSLQVHYLKNGLLKTEVNCISLEWQSDTNRTVKSIWEVTNPTPVSIDSIVTPGINHIIPGTISSLFKPLSSEVASEQSILRAHSLIEGYKFLTYSGRAYYATYGRDNVALVLPLLENFRNTFTGIAGYLPRSSGKPQVTGDIQLHLENPFGTASSADLWWQRKDRKSQVFSLGYEEPFIWKFNIGGRVQFYQNLQDGLFVMRKFHISAVKSYSTTGKWSIGGENSTVNVTEDGDSLGLRDHTVRSLVIENEWERRDISWNPTKGFYFLWRSEVGNFSVTGSQKTILYRLRSRFEIIKHLPGKWLLAMGGIGGYVHLTGKEPVPLSEQFRYGGASTLRGYHEQIFRSNLMMIGQLELRYHLNRFNRFYLFIDGAFYNKNGKLPVSGGMGIQQKIPLGILRLEYALSREDTLSRGKIHIRILGQF